jgi:hypothetical protein
MSHRNRSKNRSHRSTSKSKSPSLSAYYTPNTFLSLSPSPSPSPYPKINTRFVTPTESMEKRFYKLLEKQKNEHIETNSAKNRRELSAKNRKAALDLKYDKFVYATNEYKKMQKQKNKKSLFKRLFKAGKSKKTTKKKH